MFFCDAQTLTLNKNLFLSSKVKQNPKVLRSQRSLQVWSRVAFFLIDFKFYVDLFCYRLLRSAFFTGSLRSFRFCSDWIWIIALHFLPVFLDHFNFISFLFYSFQFCVGFVSITWIRGSYPLFDFHFDFVSILFHIICKLAPDMRQRVRWLGFGATPSNRFGPSSSRLTQQSQHVVINLTQIVTF